jgi:hypothetical protein
VLSSFHPVRFEGFAPQARSTFATAIGSMTSALVRTASARHSRIATGSS